MMSRAIFEPTTTPGNDTILAFLVVAAALHVLIILGVDFSESKPEEFKRSIEITLVDTPAKKAPKQAKMLAQENQVGAGEQDIKPKPQAQKIANEGNTSQSKHLVKAEPEQQQSRPKAHKKVVTQQKAEKKVAEVKAAPVPDKEPVAEERQHPILTPEALQQQITQLGTEIRDSQLSGEQSKIKFVSMVSAHKYLASQYLKDWENKVEKTGNLNYPDVAAKKNFSATLTMDVGINADGSIYSIRISKSSGIPELDEAAKNIVRMSAPFAPLPQDLLKELKVLVITRVWKFSDESGITTR
ncbi:TonB family protein [Methylomicrobium lacus]|uniref:TonB family protein n=1 Tax=Methylomicrobium lacus TaxID=136992 RepID=UPI0035A8C12A